MADVAATAAAVDRADSGLAGQGGDGGGSGAGDDGTFGCQRNQTCAHGGRCLMVCWWGIACAGSGAQRDNAINDSKALSAQGGR